MNILHNIGNLSLIALAATCAFPCAALCGAALGLTGVAAMVGAAAVLLVIPQ